MRTRDTQTGTLYIVATPIGNLEDITVRALNVLKTVQVILAEDTRVTRVLMRHHVIEKPLYSWHQHSSEHATQKWLDELKRGSDIALVTDAGTPAVSDPGCKLVAAAVAQNVPVVPLPGASAVTTLVSVFGQPMTEFYFWGFFPQKQKRQNELCERIKLLSGLHVFFESPYRVEKTLLRLSKEPVMMIIGRELTKLYETIYRGKPEELLVQLKQNNELRGEFCLGAYAYEL